MEYRKLISFGKSSYVVSLPKPWIGQNKLKKGDLIYMEENGQNLMLSKSTVKDGEEEKTKVINIDGKDLTMIAREVNSAYIMNHRTIILKGKDIKDKVKEIQQIFQNLIALEIMEQTSNSVVAKDFLNMEQVSIEELIRKMDIITRTMMKECCENVLIDNYENINDRDKDVNRLYFLLYRASLYNLNHLSNAMKKLKMGPIDLINHLFAGFYLEGIADETRRTARFLRKLKLNVKEKSNLTTLLHKIEQYYLDTLKSFYEADIDASLKLSSLKKELNALLDGLEKKEPDVNLVNMIARLRRLISYTHSLGRIAYQGLHYS